MTDPYANINPLTGKPYSNAYFSFKARFENQPMERPAVIAQLFEELTRFPIVFLKAGTGTTSIGRQMLALFRASNGEGARIAVTQQRRLPASDISKYVADQMDVKFGDEVGFKVKGTGNTSDKTVLAFVTEGRSSRTSRVTRTSTNGKDCSSTRSTPGPWRSMLSCSS